MSETPPMDYPEARRVPRRGGWWWWLLPLAALAGAGWLLLDQYGARGPEIVVAFSQGHGIKVGDALRYRGIQVGRVSRVGLAGDLDGVRVVVRLQPDTASLARAGSRFWIVRPRLDLSGAEGLETVVGARYLAVLPGDGPPARAFQGLPGAPRIPEPDALEIVLGAPGRGNLREGAPVTYRQVTVGSITAVALARDASHVQARVAIHPDYRGLIRANTRFWRTSGARLGADLGGVYLDVESIQGLILGGISLAVPQQPGEPARAGQRFALHEEADPEWLAWTPSLQPAGPSELERAPRLLPLARRWRADNALGLSRERERRGWALVLPGGLLGPADLLGPAAPDAEDSRLWYTDRALPLDAHQPLSPGLWWLPLSHAWPGWPAQAVRAMEEAEDILLMAHPEEPPRFVADFRLRRDDAGWRLDPALDLPPRWHGAAAVAVRDGRLVGILAIQDNENRVLPVPALP